MSYRRRADDNPLYQEYERTLQKAKDAKIALTIAERELRDLELLRNDTTGVLDATQLTLTSKIMALESELDEQMAVLAELIASANTGITYNNTLKAISRISRALVETRRELAMLESPSTTTD